MRIFLKISLQLHSRGKDLDFSTSKEVKIFLRKIYKSNTKHYLIPGGHLLGKSCLTLDPMEVARQAPLSMGFPRQEYWIGLPFLSPGDLPHSGIERRSPAQQADSLPTEPPMKSIYSRLDPCRYKVVDTVKILKKSEEK